MKNVKVIGALLLGATVMAGTPLLAHGDAMRVVTIGANLDDAQKNTMLKYFNVKENQVKLITVTNKDEREHLLKYVPEEQIGTRTVSCAYVRPTTSGGIKVRTANLNWVTGNMIASSLSTSGVKNAEVVAAAPFEVSGTGALTGVQMAYEKASGEKLDPEKKKLATEEMVVTGNLANKVGQKEATAIVNEAKKDVIKNDIKKPEEIKNTVNNIIENKGADVSKEQVDKVIKLLEQIADKDYKYSDVKDTLEHVDKNVNEKTEDVATQTEDKDEKSEDKDSIVSSVDTEALGSKVLESSTEDPNLENKNGGYDKNEDLKPLTKDEATQTDDDMEGPSKEDGNEASKNESKLTEDDIKADKLSKEDKEKFDKFVDFLKGEFGDVDLLRKTTENEKAVPVDNLSKEDALQARLHIEKMYIDALLKKDDDIKKSDDDKYKSLKLNFFNSELMKALGIDKELNAKDKPELKAVGSLSPDSMKNLYDSIMAFVAKQYEEEPQTSQTILKTSDASTQTEENSQSDEGASTEDEATQTDNE